jgi:hypothetical protein
MPSVREFYSLPEAVQQKALDFLYYIAAEDFYICIKQPLFMHKEGYILHIGGRCHAYNPRFTQSAYN